jgi:hypothetical protein
MIAKEITVQVAPGRREISETHMLPEPISPHTWTDDHRNAIVSGRMKYGIQTYCEKPIKHMTVREGTIDQVTCDTCKTSYAAEYMRSDRAL